MAIWAEIKKAINSNLNKPLDVTLGEIQTSVNNLHVTHRRVQVALGAIYNNTINSRVITETDQPVISVTGKGRILQILPISSDASGSKNGTALFTVDGKITYNGRISYATESQSIPGTYMLTDTDNRKYNYVVSNIFKSNGAFHMNVYPFLKGDLDDFIGTAVTLIEPFGLPFNNGFEIKLTQNDGQNYVDTLGVLVVYELYE